MAGLSTVVPVMTAAFAGLGTGLALIVAIGAQNAFVLRQGVRGEHVLTVAGICALADIGLISLGTLGVGAVIVGQPVLMTGMKWVGCGYLVWLGLRSLWSARRPGALDQGAAPPSRGSVIATTLALTFLNPHVYLDTVVMLGNIANQYGAGRWWFVLGACLASVTWFHVLALGARALSGPLSRPRTWQLLDVCVGLVMLALAAKLATL